MRIIFMGTPDFSVPSLETIAAEGYELIGVVTQPDRPRGRGKRLLPSPVKKWAIEKGIDIYQPVKARDEEFITQIKRLAPDLIVTAAYGQILPKNILDIPPLGCINVHASLLPKYRGASPIQQAIMDGESKTGITIMYMDEGMDTGDIILQMETLIHPDENAGDLHDRLAALGAKALSESLELFTVGKPEGIPQIQEDATYCQKIDKDMGRINWDMDIDRIRNNVRALTPWPGAYTYIGSMRLKVWEAGQVEYSDLKDITPGQIVYADEEHGLVISGSDGLIRLSKVQAPGKRAMDDVEFLRGNRLKVNTVLDGGDKV
ncbi:MAG: methionyl-tRNA formyltransferase [Clostridiales bacterium]|nr:methionyl-tRNA formyltransferase [Clostridiales bacterium]